MLISSRASRKAFTLLELIVVIVILGLLAALAIPTFARVTKRSQDASTAATVAAVLRDARALMAYQDKDVTWESALGTAAEETSAPTAVGLLAAGIGFDKVPTDPTSPARGTFQVLGDTASPTGVLLALRSKSDSICVGVATLTSASTPFCAPTADAAELVAGATTVSGAVLSGGVAAAPLPSGVTPVSLVTAPSAPTGVSVSAVTGTGATLNWTPGAVNSVPVTGYQVSVTPAGGAVRDFPVTAAGATSLALTGLSASTNYSVTVKALSAKDASSAATGSFTTLAAVTGASNASALTWGPSTTATGESTFTLSGASTVKVLSQVRPSYYPTAAGSTGSVFVDGVRQVHLTTSSTGPAEGSVDVALAAGTHTLRVATTAGPSTYPGSNVTTIGRVTVQ